MADSLIAVTGLSLVADVGGFVASVQWSAPAGLGCLPYMQPAKFEFYVSASPSFGSATTAGESLVGLYKQGGLPAATTRYVWVRAVDAAGNPGAVYPTGQGQAVTTLTTQPPANSVGPNELQNGAVTGSKIAASAVTADKIQAGSISADKIQSGAITADKVSAGAITSEKIQVSSLAAISATLGNVSINGNLVVGGTVSAGKLVSKTLTDQQIATGAVSASIMTGKGGPVRGGGTLQSAFINVPSGFVSIDFNALFELPSPNSSNFGNFACRLFRNGSQIATWVMQYDDNYSYPIALMYKDDPGSGGFSYTMTCDNMSGAGQWTIADPTMRLMNFKV